MREGGGAIMTIGRAKGDHRVERAIIDALDSPLLYGNDISRAKRLLFNIYSSSESPILVMEMQEIDDFFDQLDPNIEVIWGTSTDETLGEDAKVIILAADMDDEIEPLVADSKEEPDDDDAYLSLIDRLYEPLVKVKATPTEEEKPEPVFQVEVAPEPEPAQTAVEDKEPVAPQPAPTPASDSTLNRLRSWLQKKISEVKE